MKRNSKLYLVAAVLAAVALAGCGEKRDRSAAEQHVFRPEPSTSRSAPTQQVVMIVMDLSGSFTDKMAEDGKAYEFAIHVLDRYFRRPDSQTDKIILAQISGTEKSLMWEGSPLDLRREFPSADKFRDFLLEKADGGGSLVHDGVRNAIDYLTYHPNYGSSNARTVTLILSDMDDTGSVDSEQRLTTSLAANAQNQGAIGIYFCNQLKVEEWKRRLGSAGYLYFVVESEIVGRPQLPNFEVFPRTPR
ncbi:VWA domain-containing protein [Rubinisphaera italica]|uniref:VWFA domain-containing protein n=1 Tax=Rubinisphaera italica TaxID=2527969 RepID=A0A5C5XE83_9PLAN|nr:VWA domain-containing protein [Rubinisphaera italica]TWT60969.1 hypothetical protein Pan54_17010 [Rubinisphaera italica]